MKLLFLLAAAFFAVPSGVSARMQTVPRKISIEKEAAIPLIRGGVPCVEIVLPKQASRVTEFASKELQNLLSESFGRKIEIVNSPGTDKTSIILGDNEFSRKAGITMAALPRDGFIIRSEGNTVYIAGRDNPLTNIEWARNQLSIWANYFERGTMNAYTIFWNVFSESASTFPVNSEPLSRNTQNFRFPGWIFWNVRTIPCVSLHGIRAIGSIIHPSGEIRESAPRLSIFTAPDMKQNIFPATTVFWR